MRYWLIKKLAGNRGVLLNATVRADSIEFKNGCLISDINFVGKFPRPFFLFPSMTVQVYGEKSEL